MASLQARSSAALLADNFRQWHACAAQRVRCKRETAMRLRGKYVGRAFQQWRQHVAAWKSTRARLAAALGKLESSICTQVTECSCYCLIALNRLQLTWYLLQVVRAWRQMAAKSLHTREVLQHCAARLRNRAMATAFTAWQGHASTVASHR